MTEPTDAERAEFEEMMRRETFEDLSRFSDGGYKSYEARVGWIAWQAARRTPAPVGVEPVASVHRDTLAMLNSGQVKPWDDGARLYPASKARFDAEFVGVYTTPQPTQAQAGAVAMPKFSALRFHARRDKKATVTLLFNDHETADAWVRGITHKEGGQHAE